MKEGFTELLVPVLRDLPLVTHLNLELGYRYSDYKYAGPVSTWKALADWALTPDFRLRGGFQRANRAPNLVELFDPGTSAVQIGPGDVCSAAVLAHPAWRRLQRQSHPQSRCRQGPGIVRVPDGSNGRLGLLHQ